jgi:polysaccharide export outer membrane protein
MSIRVLNMATKYRQPTSAALCVCCALSVPLVAQSTRQPQSANTSSKQAVASPTLPKDYVIGVEDVLNVVFWKDKELSAEVLVRPDGKISLPMLNDVPAAGMTPEQLAAAVQQAAAKFVRDPRRTVIVKEIRSRKVYRHRRSRQTRDVPACERDERDADHREAGGFLESANKGDVVVVRNENGQERRFKFNYNEVVRGKNVGRTSSCSQATRSSSANAHKCTCTNR